MKRDISAGLYIHVPFCVRKCPYCDFYSVTNTELSEAFTKAAVRNVRGKKADTVYFGGGTPSLLSAEQIFRILSAADIEADAEITIECNPNSADKKYFADIRSAGVNRLSLGIQSLSDRELTALGRLHNAEEAIIAVKDAYKAGFRNISADIMLATAYQTEKSLENTLNGLFSLPLDHISAYMLKIEEGTPYCKNENIRSLIPDEEKTADMYLEAVRLLEENGFEQYEISNFSKSGYESKHNLKYWRCEEYYGIGPSAHSFIDGVRKACPPSLESFIENEIQTEVVTDENAGTLEERIMLALRLTKEGVSGSYFDEKTLSALENADYIRRFDGRIALTPKGCLVSNEIICELCL